MAIQLSVEVRNARLDAIETIIGASPILRIRTGAPPANPAAADTGTILAEMTLPADFMAPANAGAKALSGTWEDLTGNAAGDAAHFRIYTSGGACRLQGTVSGSGGGGDLVLSNVNIAVGQPVSVTSFTLTDGNA